MLIGFIERLRSLPIHARKPMLTNKELDSMRDNLARSKYGLGFFGNIYF